MGNDQRYGGGSSSNNSSSSSSGGGGGGGGGGKKGKNKSGGGGGSSNSSEKPKQPQRGLGVAQLEKIRLQTQMASCGFLPPHPHPHPHPHHHHHPLFPSFPTPVPPPPPPPPPPSLQHLQEDMRMQGGYNHQSALHSAASFGYSSPSIASSSSFGYPPNFMMGMGDHMERTGNIRYGESQPRWNPNNFSPMPDSQHYMQPPSMVTRHLLSHVEQNNKSRNGLFETTGGSNSQNSESSEEEDLDLELKL